MKPFLLDVNFLVVDMAAPRPPRRGFRTCPFAQAGFIRISSDSKFDEEAVLPMDDHKFWPDDLTPEKALRTRGGLLGHNQVTDAYLLALAESKGGVVATPVPTPREWRY